MKKVSVKFLSILLTVLILGSMLPLAVTAKTLYSPNPVPNFAGDTENFEKVLALDNLGDGTNNIENSETAYTPKSHVQGASDVSGDNLKTASGSRTSTTWAGVVGKTNLSLNNDSQYIIEFEAQLLMSTVNILHFVFALPEGSDLHTKVQSIGVGIPEKASYVTKGRGTPAGNQYGLSAALPSDVDFWSLIKFTVVIDKADLYIYADGVLLGKHSVASEAAENGGKYFVDTSLALGIVVRGLAVAPASDYITVKNVNVYKGTFAPRTENFNTGDVLLKVNNLNDTVNKSEYNDIAVTKKTPYLCEVNEDGLGFISKATGGYTMYGLNTNLPLDGSSKYTIEYYAKRYEAASLVFAFSGLTTTGAADDAAGIYFYSQSLTTILKNVPNYYNASATPAANLWDAYKGEDGFTRFAIEIDGFKIKVWAGETELAAFDFADGAKPGFTSTTLSLGVRQLATAAFNGKHIADFKDITVTAGNTMSMKYSVNFVKDGDSVKSQEVSRGGTVTAFPNVAAAEGKVPVWFYEDTNTVAELPLKVYEDMTLECREIDKNYSKVVAAQYTAPEDNEQSVRFIATIYSLDASAAGFDVMSYYTVGDTVTPRPRDPKEITYVYSKLNATENGTVTTVRAGELGGIYLIAIAVDKVPANVGQIDFYVRSYLVIEGEKVYSESVRVTIVDGEINQSAAALEIPD